VADVLRDVPGISVHEGRRMQCGGEPANSFGFMDGGIDLAYMEVFGEGIQARVQSQISEHAAASLSLAGPTSSKPGMTRLSDLNRTCVGHQPNTCRRSTDDETSGINRNSTSA
jgi:hypothetical protein